MAKTLKKINLALQGGGAHGALAWGVLDYLLEDGTLEIDSISATSAGAVNAAVLTQGLIKGGNEGARAELRHFWEEICHYGELLSPIKKTPLEIWLGIPTELSLSYSIFNSITHTFSPYEFNPINFNPLRELLEKMIDYDVIRASDKVKLFTCATNVRTGKVRIFTNKEMNIDATLASCCLPFLFQAVTIDDECYWDGGYMGNPAIFPLIYGSPVCDILIIHINPIERKHIPKTSNEILNRINEISFNSSLMREMRAIAFVTRMIEDGWIKDEYRDKLKKLNMHSIRSDKIMDKFSVASKFETDWEFLNNLFEIGRGIAAEWLSQNYSDIGVRSTLDLNEFL